MASAIDDLREVAVIAATSGSAAGLRFAIAVGAYEQGASQGLTLHQALGLDGFPAWHEVERKAKIRDLILGIARQYFPNLSPSAQAARIGRAVGRYQAAGWARDRRYAAPPAALHGKIEAQAFRLLKLGAPCSARTIRRILSENQ